MAQYRLKKNCENFTIVDGSDAGKKFVKGKIYNSVPTGYVAKFDAVPVEIPVPKDKEAAAETTTAKDKTVNKFIKKEEAIS
ncbi:MAG: hypothetical protein WC374_11670 [Phycisphaerae bacterium]|jgi:hypothetical protein